MKPNVAIWLTSIGMNSTSELRGGFIEHPGGYRETQISDDTITVQIQLKDAEGRVLATKIKLVDNLHSRTLREHFIHFDSPVLLRPNDWYILSFTVISVIIFTFKSKILMVTKASEDYESTRIVFSYVLIISCCSMFVFSVVFS